jgi:thiamine-phosphate diphosphorylase
VTDRATCAGDLAAAVEACVAAGVDLVQVRERTLGGAALLEHVDAILAAARRGARARGGRVLVVVNRRLDVGLAAGADGAHLGFDALPADAARALLGPDACLGVSAHAPEVVLALRARGDLDAGAQPAGAPTSARALVDYAHLAPIFPPRSKPATRPPLGLDALARACTGAVAVLAQGGVTAENAAACMRAGAAGVAVTGELLLAPDAAAAARRLREELRRGV